LVHIGSAVFDENNKMQNTNGRQQLMAKAHTDFSQVSS
jgi:hypothetical protein